MIYAIIEGVVHEERPRGGYATCCGCANFEEIRPISACHDVRCVADERADGKNVIFVRWAPHD